MSVSSDFTEHCTGARFPGTLTRLVYDCRLRGESVSTTGLTARNYKNHFALGGEGEGLRRSNVAWLVKMNQHVALHA